MKQYKVADSIIPGKDNAIKASLNNWLADDVSTIENFEELEEAWVYVQEDIGEKIEKDRIKELLKEMDVNVPEDLSYSKEFLLDEYDKTKKELEKLKAKDETDWDKAQNLACTITVIRRTLLWEHDYHLP